MPKKLSPLLVLGATATVALSAPSVQAAVTIPLSRAADQANINLKPNEGVYIHLPSSLPIYRFAIDDGSVLTLGDDFTPGTPIIRVVGKSPGKTGLGLIVQDGSKLQTLNFTVEVGSKGTRGTIQIVENTTSQPQHPVDQVVNGLRLANAKGQIPPGSPLHVATTRWIDAVKSGQSAADASDAVGVQASVLQRLARLSQSTPVVQKAPAKPPKQTVASSKKTEGDAAEPSLQKRIAALENQVQSLSASKNADTPQVAKADQPKEQPKTVPKAQPKTQLTPPANPSIDQMTPSALAHAVKAGLHRYPEEYPYRSRQYDQVNTAVILLRRGNSPETASRHSGLKLQTLQMLAGDSSLQVSDRINK